MLEGLAPKWMLTFEPIPVSIRSLADSDGIDAPSVVTEVRLRPRNGLLPGQAALLRGETGSPSDHGTSADACDDRTADRQGDSGPS